jgi:D-serine deaminase-like pyridoxal phosphate-dependent protein
VPGAARPALGDCVWLVPGHCDPTINLHDAMLGVRGGLDAGVVEQVVRVDARGRVT